MDNKLQELTDKLFNEGLSKGKAEGEALLAQSKEKAAAIVEEARKEAAAIVEKARKEAEELSTKVSNDIRMASSQSIQATKKDIENLVIQQIEFCNIILLNKASEVTAQASRTQCHLRNSSKASSLPLHRSSALKSLQTSASFFLKTSGAVSSLSWKESFQVS